MADEPLKMSFPGASVAEANQLAASLQDCLRDVGPEVQAERERDNPESMDFGATLGVLLAPAVVSAVAKGIAAWLSRNSGVRLEIQQKDGSVVVLSHLDSHDAARIVKALAQRRA